MTELADRSVATRASGPQSGVDPDVAAVADNVVSLMRSFGKARARMLAAADHDVEWSSHVILKCLQGEGPLRAGALAECIQSDPSTVSRQVAALVKDGLLERRADPDDGRASLLVLTDAADDVLAAHDQRRLQYFADMLTDWDADDLQRFAGLLARFVDAYDNANTHGMSDRAHRSPGRSGGTT
jgi:DNA-binding MarR family transcriptional regulator